MRPQSDLKRANQRKVIRLIATKAAITRVDLAKLTGLTKMTITNLVNEWISDGILKEDKAPADNNRGRPKMILRFSDKAPKIIGFMIQQNRITLSIGTLSGEIEKSWSKTIGENDPIVIVDDLINNLLSEYINTTFLLASYINVDGLPYENVIDFIKKKINIEIFQGSVNDAILSYEHLKNANIKSDNILLINLDQDISSSYLGEEKDRTPIRPNLGHVSIDYNGLSCPCGRKGCLNAYISKPVMEKKMRDISKMKLDFAGFCQLQNKKNDSKIDWVFKDMMEKLGHGISNVLMVVNIDSVVLSGELQYIPDRYISKLEKDLRVSSNQDNLIVRKSSLTKSEETVLPIYYGIKKYLNL